MAIFSFRPQKMGLLELVKAAALGPWQALIMAISAMAAIYVVLFGTSAFIAAVQHYVIGQYHRLISENVAYYVTGLAIVIAVEVPVLRYRNSTLYRLRHPSRSTVMDGFCFFMDILGYLGIFVSLFSLGLADIVPRFIKNHIPGIPAIDYPILQWIWLFVALDFLKYWRHRLQHAIPIWWEVHKFHHAATELNVITTGRIHPLDSAYQLIFQATTATILGANVQQFFLLTLIGAMQAGWTHSMLPWRFGWIGRWVFVSPVVHRLHHSPQPAHFDRNFSTTLVIWDRLFGTWYTGHDVNEIVGVTDNYYDKNGIPRDLIDCAFRSYSALLKLQWYPRTPLLSPRKAYWGTGGGREVHEE
jgi:sterol desaturase/sphingolipid hydroxylase (fatty acid hydroxylase superfamily)